MFTSYSDDRDRAVGDFAIPEVNKPKTLA